MKRNAAATAVVLSLVSVFASVSLWAQSLESIQASLTDRARGVGKDISARQRFLQQEAERQADQSAQATLRRITEHLIGTYVMENIIHGGSQAVLDRTLKNDTKLDPQTFSYTIVLKWTHQETLQSHSSALYLVTGKYTKSVRQTPFTLTAKGSLLGDGTPVVSGPIEGPTRQATLSCVHTIVAPSDYDQCSETEQ